MGEISAILGVGLGVGQGFAGREVFSLSPCSLCADPDFGQFFVSIFNAFINERVLSLGPVDLGVSVEWW